MKSNEDTLRKRGLATKEEINRMAHFSQKELITLLHSDNPCNRTGAAKNLSALDFLSADELLNQLAEEKCLYTKLAICESLEHGNIQTARKMVNHLGIIGKNQHKELPLKVSAKKSFPLPRDIIARSLGRMDTSVFPVLLEVLTGNEIKKIREALDAVGFMVFYHKELAVSINAEILINLLYQYGNNSILVWKIILCLSAFPLTAVEKILEKYALQDDIIGAEAQRSLAIIRQNSNNTLNPCV